MTEKFGFIAAEKADPSSPYPVRSMCAWLGVSTSGFYDHLAAEPSARSVRRALVADYVQAAFDRGRGAYGVRRVHALLQRCPDERVRGVSLNLVRAIMAERGLVGCQPRASAPPPSPTRTPRLRHPIWSAATSPHGGPATSWSVTSPTSAPGPAGCIWPPSSTAAPVK